MMDIVVAKPPNFDAIRRAFPLAEDNGVLFCHGTKIYNPDGVDIPPFIIAHEEAHSISQGDDPDGWWRRYIESEQFRFNEELLAHRIEYAFLLNERKANMNRAQRRHLSQFCAERLRNPLYGIRVTKEKAVRLIRNGELHAA